MTTFSDSLGFNKGSAGFHDATARRMYRTEVVLDFAKIAAARSAAGVAALASTDVLQIIPLPAKSYVLAVGYDVTTPEGATATFDLGDGSTTNGYLNDISLNSTASGVMALALTEATPNTVTGYSNGKYYAAADTIDMVLNNDSIDTAVVRIWALVMDCA
jgi:hypothetical protein